MFTQREIELIQCRINIFADIKIAETNVVFQHLFPVIVTAVDANRFLQWVGVELLIAFRREGQFIEKIGAPFQQGRNSFSGEQLCIGLTVNQEIFHFRQVEVAEPGDDHEREAHQDQELRPQPWTTHGTQFQSSLFRRPTITVAIFALDAVEIGINALELFADISHVGIDRVVGHQRLHGRIH